VDAEGFAEKLGGRMDTDELENDRIEIGGQFWDRDVVVSLMEEDVAEFLAYLVADDASAFRSRLIH